MPVFPKSVLDAARVASRMRPKPGSKRALAEAKAGAASKPLPKPVPHKVKRAVAPADTITTPSGRKVIVR